MKKSARLFNTRVLRYALGVTIAMAIVQGIGWPLGYMVPALILGYLLPPAVPLSIKDGLKFILAIGVASITGLIIGRLVVYPLVYLLIMFLFLMLIFYAKESVLPPLLKTWLLITILLLPLLSLQSHNISLIIAPILFLDAIVTVLIVWFMYLILPNPKKTEKGLELKAKQELETLSEKERFNKAFESSIVIFPLMVMFNLFQWSGGALILIYAAILSSTPNLSRDLKVGKFLLLANALGGLLSIIFYNIMTYIPEYYFLLLLTFLVALNFAIFIMSEKPIGKLFASAFSAILFIIGAVFSSTDEAGSAVYARLFQILFAVSYVVLAFGFIEEWKKYIRNIKSRNRNKQLISSSE